MQCFLNSFCRLCCLAQWVILLASAVHHSGQAFAGKLQRATSTAVLSQPAEQLAQLHTARTAQCRWKGIRASQWSSRSTCGAATKISHRSAPSCPSPTLWSMHCAAQHNIAWLHTAPQYLCDPGMSAGSENHCILGSLFLRSNLSREQCGPSTKQLFSWICGDNHHSSCVCGNCTKATLGLEIY